jgi:DNA-binding MarR family transcriptional regulator
MAEAGDCRCSCRIECLVLRHSSHGPPCRQVRLPLALALSRGETAAMKKQQMTNDLGGAMARSSRSRASPWTNAAARRSASAKVDKIFEQWRTERPDIDPSPVQVYGHICQLYLQTTEFINKALEPYGLYRGTFDVLTALRRAGAPYLLTPKQLTTSLLLSAAGLTSRLNALEARHLIARLPEPNDRRTIRIQLTAAGEALVNKVIPIVFDEQWKRLLRLDEVSRKRLALELKRFAEVVGHSLGSEHADLPVDTQN